MYVCVFCVHIVCYCISVFYRLFSCWCCWWFTYNKLVEFVCVVFGIIFVYQVRYSCWYCFCLLFSWNMMLRCFDLRNTILSPSLLTFAVNSNCSTDYPVTSKCVVIMHYDSIHFINESPKNLYIFIKKKSKNLCKRCLLKSYGFCLSIVKYKYFAVDILSSF